MAFVIADRVQETTTTQGTGTVVLAGAVTGYQTFTIIGDTNQTYYTIADQAGANWEVGIGTYYTANTSLARTTILASSNSNAAVSFGIGTKSVFVTYPAEKAIYSDTNNVTTITNFVSGNVAITGGTISGVTYNGLGTMSTQNANSVSITGGTISGTTESPASLSTANAVITGGSISNVSLSNVTYGGLGTMSTQNANNVSITGGTIATTNVSTSNLIATGGTINNVIIGASTATNASFTNLTLTNQLIANASSGTSGQVLTSAGANVSPYWANASGGGGSTGIGNSSILALNVNITANATINAGVNGFSVGPVNTANGVVVTITSGQRWVII